MAANHTDTPLNPTVEEVQDEAESGIRNGMAGGGLSCAQICTQHDSVLSSHLQTLQALKGEISADGEASKMISTMIERTQKLVMQFEMLKKSVIPRAARNPGFARSGGGDSNGSLKTTPGATSNSEDSTSRKRRKRNRMSNESQPHSRTSPAPQHQSEPQSQQKEPVLDLQRQKRKRTDLAIPGGNEDVQNVMPVSLETEDISDEVQRRLKIKEEKRRKRDASAGGKPEKRKRERDSLASNESTSSFGGPVKPGPRKKVRLGEGANR